ncbi:MAG: hypothetical protein HYW02_00245 [Deltaproteobacteria bacterium]|nr:hypothetical protein [Deltaproteobacteria bacterium]MBI2499917.1 hypothetical protein [Deltaproteobacteria bacterium]
MKNQELAIDYITRAGHRLAALEVLYARKSYADVVREAQEEEDATEALENARWVYSVCKAAFH